MNRIRYTLLSDGSSDRVLMPILDWLLHRLCPEYPVESQWADLRRLPIPPRTLSDKIGITLDLYETNLLFIHRDAERESIEMRKREIMSALNGMATPPAVCVVPVRMQEAWLLFDEKAIRSAAGNPNGAMPLQLPTVGSIESLPDPKDRLYALIRDASGRSGTRLKKLKPNQCVHRISESIDDFSPLRSLPAFQSLEQELEMVVRERGWNA
jgi:hypothetical protein